MNNNKYVQLIHTHLTNSKQVKELIINDLKLVEKIINTSEIIANAFSNRNKILIFGNGGSAADAQHISAEFTSILSKDCIRPGLPAIALTTDTSFITANANDFGFEGIFERQVEALANESDILLGISTSGYSNNVVKGLKKGKELKTINIGFTGEDGGDVGLVSEYLINVPSDRVQHIQEAHICVGHIICELVEYKMGFRNE